MAKSVVIRIDRNLARRLREARREVGLSTRAVSAKLPRRFAVSHTTIASYENGTTTPPIDILGALATLYQRPLNWFLENRESLGEFRYRNLRARTPLAERRQFEAVSCKWAEAYLRLGRHLKDQHRFRATTVYTGQEDLSPEMMAAVVRTEYLDLDDRQPIMNMVGALESFSAWALEIKSSFGTDGATARHGNEFVVVINPSVTNECVRMNAAHELAHLLYHGCKLELGWTDEDVEKRAFAFAGPLIMPATQVKEAFEGRSFLRLIQYKEKFGISLSAMIYMAERAGIINTTASRWLFSEMTRQGWRHNEPGYIWRDRAIGFEMMLEQATQMRLVTWSDAERVTGIREIELRQRVLGAINHTASDPLEREDRPTLKYSI